MFHLWCRKLSRYWKIQKKYKIAPPPNKNNEGIPEIQTIRWMMESSRGLIPEILGYNNNSPIPGTAALLVAATHPLLLLVLLQHVGRPMGLQLVRYIQCWQNYTRDTPRILRHSNLFFFEWSFTEIYRGEAPLNHHWGAYFWNMFQASYADPIPSKFTWLVLAFCWDSCYPWFTH